MTDEEKLKIFEFFLKKIKTKPIRAFTEFCVLHFPDYFWTLPASTTSKNHGSSETLLGHVISCLNISEQVCEHQFKDHWNQKQKDQLIASLILHDGWRCGEPGNENRITQKIIDEKDLDQELLGNFMTDRNHAEVGYRQLIFLAAKFNKLADENNTDRIGEKNLAMILKSVRYHYGPFMNVEKRPFSLSWPYDSVVIQCHTIDFHQCHNSMYITRGHARHTETK
jgi:hypothetical protein